MMQATAIDMTELANHTSKLLHEVTSSGQGLLVTRRHKQLMVAIVPATGERHDLEIPVRELSRATSRVVGQVREAGEPAIITNRGSIVAEMAPIGPELERRYAADLAAASSNVMANLRQADRDLSAGRAVRLDDAWIAALPDADVSPRASSTGKLVGIATKRARATGANARAQAS